MTDLTTTLLDIALGHYREPEEACGICGATPDDEDGRLTDGICRGCWETMRHEAARRAD